MIKPIAIGTTVLLVVLIGTVLIVAATRPDTFRVKRTASIDAPPEKIFALINDFQQWESWSPYETLDPDMTRSYSGPPNGEGAVYEWDGDGNVGKGRTTILESSPHARIAMSLEMFRPFRCHNDVEFTLTRNGDSTDVTWAMEGPSSFITKVVSVFINMDRMVGGQFESGLAKLKTVSRDVTEAVRGGWLRSCVPAGRSELRRSEDGTSNALRNPTAEVLTFVAPTSAAPTSAALLVTTVFRTRPESIHFLSFPFPSRDPRETPVTFTTYLTFDGTCEAAMKFYQKCLGGEIVAMIPFGDAPWCEHVPADHRDKIMHGRLIVGDQMLMGSDCTSDDPHQGIKGCSVALGVSDPSEAERVFAALSEKGTTTMPLQETPWAARFGMFVDQFGVPWMVNCETKASN